MNLKWFGIAALVGLGYLWLTERAHAGQRVLTASWERESDRGKIMANGQPHNPDRFTCASWDYPLDTLLRVTVNGKVVVAVVVTDRGPAKRLLKTRQLDLSRSAFLALAPLEKGLIRVTVEVL